MLDSCSANLAVEHTSDGIGLAPEQCEHSRASHRVATNLDSADVPTDHVVDSDTSDSNGSSGEQAGLLQTSDYPDFSGETSSVPDLDDTGVEEDFNDQDIDIEEFMKEYSNSTLPQKTTTTTHDVLLILAYVVTFGLT